MTDFEAKFASSLETVLGSQPGSEALAERLQRIQQLEQERQERLRSRNAESQPEPETRMSIRDRIVQQTQNQRRRETSRARRAPIRRAASFHTGDTNVQIANEIQDFRETFEAARSNIFGSRLTGSSENISGSQVARHTLDIPANQEGSQPTSGSSTPSRSSRRTDFDGSYDLERAFSSALSEFGLGSNSNLSDTNRRGNGSRSSSATREGRNNSSTNYQRYVMSSTTDVVSRTAAGRRSRLPERRRQTVGVTSSELQEARAQTRNGFHTSAYQPSETRTNDINNSVVTRDTLPRARDLLPYSSIRSSYFDRKIEIHEELTRPVLALNDERVVYIDEKGHCHWLEKNHPILKAAKDRSAPSVVIKYKPDVPINGEEPNASVIDIPGDPEERYNKLRDLIINSKFREGTCGDTEDQSNGKNGFKKRVNTDLDETDSRNKRNDSGIDQELQAIEEKFKHVSYYTKPRPRPSLDSYKLTRKCKSIYDFDESDQSENDNENPISTEHEAVNGYHVSVTDIAESSSITDVGEMYPTVDTAPTVNTGSRDMNRVDFVSVSDLGLRSESAFLRRTQSMHESTLRTENGAPRSTLVRHGSFEATSSRLNHQVSPHSDVHDEVESIINRLQQRHAYAEIPIDTSHLDLEEMRMIQKALEENPSPPPSPIETETLEITDNIELNYEENFPQSSDMVGIVVEPVENIDRDGLNFDEPSPLSPVCEDTAETEADVDQNDSVHDVFNEFVSTATEEHTLDLPRGYISGNR